MAVTWKKLAYDDEVVKQSLATAANDFIVASGEGAFVKKSLAEVQALVGGGGGVSTVGITIEGGGSAITTGVKGYVVVPYGATITGWYLIGAPSGSLVVDVWKAAGAIPTVANTIAGSEKPTLSSAQLANNTSLSSWTTAVSASDVIGFNVDSCSGCTWASLVIVVTKT